MAGYGSRANSDTFTSGDTIKAAHLNDEFDQLVAAFHETTGHTHDGSTDGDGGPVSTLYTNAASIGTNANTDVVLTFNGSSNDGVLTWMEDEDYFKFGDDLMVVDNETLIFGTDSNWTIKYDESGDDDLVFTGSDMSIESSTSAKPVLQLLNTNADANGATFKFNKNGASVADSDVIGNIDFVSEDDGSNVHTYGRIRGTVVDMTGGQEEGGIEFYVAEYDGTLTKGMDIVGLGSDGNITVDISTHDGAAGGLKLGGTLVTSTATELNLLDGLNCTTAELNLLDGSAKSTSSITIADTDAFIVIDGTTTKQIPASDIKTYAGTTGLTASRALVSNGSGALVVSDVTSTELSYLDISTLGTSEASKAVTVDSNGDLLIPDSDKFKFGAGSDMQVYHDGTNSYITNSEGALKIATETSGIAVTIGHGTSEVTVADNLTVTGDFTVNGATTTLNTTTLTVGDTLIKLNQGYTGSAYDQGVVFTRGNGSSSNTQNMAFIWDESEDTFATIQASTEDGTTAGNVTVNDYANLHVGALTADDNSVFTGNVTAANVVVGNDGDIGSAGATDAMQISSAGIVTFKDDIKIKDGGTIGVASAADAMTISSAGIVTFKDDILLKDAATIGNASVADVMTLASTGVVTFKDDIVIKDAGTIGSASDTDAMAISSGGVVNFTQSPTVSSAAIKTAGKETMWVPASAMYPTTTNGCAALAQVEGTAGRPEMKCLDFDTSSDENAQFSVAFPKSWNESTITFRAFFSVSGTNTGTVKFELAGVALADNGLIDTAFGTAVGPTAKAHSGTSGDVNITAESGNVTIAGSPGADEIVFFNIHRDVSDDDQTGDARLLGIQIFYTTDAANDA